MTLFDDLRDCCRPNVPLAPLTWFHLGGPARWLIEPRDEPQLITVLHRAREAGLPVRFLGLGANVLVRDAGVDGAVIRLAAPAFQQLEWTTDSARVGAGVHLTKLVRACVHAGRAGLEVIAGIPGTVGGGIRMNCGGRFGQMSDSIRRVRLIDRDGRVVERRRDELGFGYRKSQLGDAMVVSAEIELRPTDSRALVERFKEIWLAKSRSQPALEQQSAGCIFKNPDPQRSAGRLIDECGLKGRRIGAAEVSPIHANFIVAHPGGRAADVIALIEHVEEQVYSRTGVRLEREVEVW